MQRMACEQAEKHLTKHREIFAQSIGRDAASVDRVATALNSEKKSAEEAHRQVVQHARRLENAARECERLAAQVRAVQAWRDVPDNVRSFFEMPPEEHLAGLETTGLAVPAALCLTIPQKKADGSCVMTSLGCVLEQEDTSEDSMDTLEALMLLWLRRTAGA